MESLAYLVGRIYLGLIALGAAVLIFSILAWARSKFRRTAWVLIALGALLSIWATVISVPLGIIPATLTLVALIFIVLRPRAPKP